MSEPGFHFEIHPSRIADTDGNKRWHYLYFAEPPPIRVMSFKGGGTRVLVYIKFLEIAHRLGIIDSIQEVGGSSSGSIAGAFAAIYYQDPKERTKALEAVTNCDRYDIYSDAPGWYIYKVITFPLFVVSKGLEFISNVIGKAAAFFNKRLPGKIIGIPLRMIAGVFSLASTLTSPRFIPGIINLVTKGGVYHGNQIEKTLREQIHKDVHAGLHAILLKLRQDGNEAKRQQIIDRVVEIGLGRREKGRLVLTQEMTLTHLHELSIITDYKFKSYYTTGVRLSDRSLVVFNHETRPPIPIYKAMRIAINFPRYYMPVVHHGEKYIDGGAINNAPVGLAHEEPMHPTHAELNATDHLSRLNVRVEYPHDLHHHLWRVQPAKGKIGRFFNKVITAIVKLFANGVDVFATDKIVTDEMKMHYAQRTIQIPDFGIGVMEENIGTTRRNHLDKKIERKVSRFFALHQNEKVWESYAQPGCAGNIMPESVCRKLLSVLRNPAVSTNSIFIFPDKTPEELENMRAAEIHKMERILETASLQQSTSVISRALDMEPVYLPPETYTEEDQAENSENIDPLALCRPASSDTNIIPAMMTGKK